MIDENAIIAARRTLGRRLAAYRQAADYRILLRGLLSSGGSEAPHDGDGPRSKPTKSHDENPGGAGEESQATGHPQHAG